MAAARTKVYLDLDPAFNQLWHAQGIDMHFDGHDRFVTVGQAIGTPELPRADLRPRLDPDGAAGRARALAGRRGRRRAHHDDRQLARLRLGRARGRALRAEGPLDARPDGPAARTDAPFLLALDIHPDETPDLEALDRNGWQLVDPATVARTPTRIASSSPARRPSSGIAKSGYVLSRCGWFSDRSACYLASGRPVVAQDTGFGRFLPTGEGLLSLRDPRTTRSPASRRCAPTTPATRGRRGRSPRSTSTRDKVLARLPRAGRERA